MRDEFRNVENIGMETRWKDIMALVEAKKATKSVYNEASQMDILTAFEETVKDFEREDT